MKKKTTMLLMFMLCFVAQQASAFRIKARVPSSSEGSTDYSSLISTVVICGIILYIVLKNWSKIRILFRGIASGARMEKNTDLTEDQQRKLLLSGVFSAQKATLFNVVKTGMDSNERDKMFTQGWGITDKASAIDTLDYLRLSGTRRYFPQVVESLKLKNKQEIQQYINDTFENEEDMRNCWEQVQYAFESMEPLMKEQIIKDENDFVRIGPDAWDAGRLVFMARLCREHNYITDEQLWQYIDAADEIAHRTLTNWEDFGKSYIIGRCLWCGTANYFEVMAGHAKKMYTNTKSPWKTFPFAK
ncbi:DUF1266 domain-containing protein [Segatella oris]|uniref:DUF1266 domain-containing protein n=1 Tax=Segatella oris TaxID=28135 RepID=A0A3S4X5N8_9BACT|nr:DUF1266 domain-containing protein [Segatella oris]VEH14496.1 Uncharacterised protein [Segatella oris]